MGNGLQYLFLTKSCPVELIIQIDTTHQYPHLWIQKVIMPYQNSFTTMEHTSPYGEEAVLSIVISENKDRRQSCEFKEVSSLK